MSAAVAPCSSCGHPMPPDVTRCPSCRTPRADGGGRDSTAAGYLLLLTIVVGCGLVLLKLLGLWSF